jgi:FAD/FMN-containing dehydrogenase
VRISAPDLAGLDGALAGSVLVPGSPGYESARKPALARFHHIRPQAIVRCENADDVAETLAFARRWGVRAAPRSGGHCFAGRSSTGGIVLDVTPMHAVSVSGGRATVGAGARLGELYDALQQHDVTIPAGCGPTVGIAGLTLGGGIGLLGRKYGLTCDRLVGARVVLADGRIVDCDPDREPELFWALRGAGGGQFGVVTSLTFDTVPEPTTTRFELRWSRASVEETVAAWQRWAPGTPDEVTANLTVVAEPGEPPQPILFGASLREEAPTRELLQEFCSVAGASPEVDLRGGLAYHHLKNTFQDLDPREEPVLGLRIRSEFFARPMRPSTINALLATLINGQATGRRQLTFTALGGAYNRVDAGATAFAHRGELFILEHIAEAPSAWVDRSWQVAHADGSGGVYPNFPDPDLADWTEAYYGTNYERLRRVKRTYDPQNLFRFEQSL